MYIKQNAQFFCKNNRQNSILRVKLHKKNLGWSIYILFQTGSYPAPLLQELRSNDSPDDCLPVFFNKLTSF